MFICKSIRVFHLTIPRMAGNVNLGMRTEHVTGTRSSTGLLCQCAGTAAASTEVRVESTELGGNWHEDTPGVYLQFRSLPLSVPAGNTSLGELNGFYERLDVSRAPFPPTSVSTHGANFCLVF